MEQMKVIKAGGEGSRFQELIESKWDTQDDAAKAFKVGQGTISRWTRIEKFGFLFFSRHSETLLANGRNPEYIRNPFVSKIARSPSKSSTEIILTNIREMRAHIDELEMKLASGGNVL